MAFQMGAHKEGLQKAIDQFLGVDFRLQYVPSQVPLACFNDAKSTNWDATFTALKALKGEGEASLYLILGGAKRGRGDSVPRSLLDFKRSDPIHLSYRRNDGGHGPRARSFGASL